MIMWESINPTTDELISLDMILMDEEGQTIHAFTWKNLIDTFRSKIKEQSIYAFNNLKVVESMKCRPTSNENKIFFAYNTKVKEVKGSAEVFPDFYFSFTTKETLQERAEKDIQCADVVGLLTQMKPVEKDLFFDSSSMIVTSALAHKIS
nr:uncharacterized protein LOC120964431 [Aegilops tauschii subsp. strangulata]